MTQNSFHFEVHGNKDIIASKHPVMMTIGNFDGVHLGHKYLIDSIKKLEKNIPIVIVTFSPHSHDFFHPQNPKPLLTSLTDKISLLLDLGVSAVVVQDFDERFSQISADDFCTFWLHANFNIQSIILGHDFCYGKNRQGNFDHMQNFGNKYSWKTYQSNALINKFNNEKPISSSFIRAEIAEGKMENANIVLGHKYSLSGIVTHGDQRGRTIGFPTANLKPACHYALPKFGVYACFLEIEGYGNKLFPAVMNCGIRPSVGKDLKLQIEAHILNFNEDIYDRKIKFYPEHFIRGEKKFSNIEELKYQINLDIIEAKKYFSA